MLSELRSSRGVRVSGVLLFWGIWLFLGGCEQPQQRDIKHSTDTASSGASYGKLTTEQLEQLGERLFFEKALSIDSTISCASCHIPQFAFADTLALSLGVGGAMGKRNAPSLINVTAASSFNRDGGVSSLQVQAITPITDPLEMGFDIHLAPQRLFPTYRPMLNSFGIDTFAPSLLLDALAAFQHTLVSGTMIIETDMASPAAMRGKALFESDRTGCMGCHSPPLYSDFSFRNNDIYAVNRDRGREEVTLDAADRGAFKVPSLINVAITAPYMHDGSFSSLHDVVAHYNRGGADNKWKDPAVRPLNLTNAESDDLVEFLRALTEIARADKLK